MSKIFNDVLSIQDMLPFFSESRFADDFILHTRLESTNDTAKELAMSGAKHGTIIMADSQSAGRGRFGRSFYSPPGSGIYISFILYPSMRYFEDNPFSVTAYAAVSVCKAIEKTTGKYPQVKWVNDILLNGKKICGILTESVMDSKSGGFLWVVVGIGINFIKPDAGYPEELKNTAGSLFCGVTPTITRNELTAELVNHMLDTSHWSGNYIDEPYIFNDQICDKIKCEDDSSVSIMLNEYRKRLMILGKRVIITGYNESYEAIALDIDVTGRLTVQKDNGEVYSICSGEIEINAV